MTLEFMIKDVYLLTKNNKTMESTQKRSRRHSYPRHAPTGKRRKRSRGPEFKWAHWIYAHIDLNIMLHNQRADSSRSLDEGHQSVHTYPCLKTVKRGLTGNGWDTTGCKSHSSFPPTLPNKRDIELVFWAPCKRIYCAFTWCAWFKCSSADKQETADFEPHNNLLHFHHKASCCANQVRSRCRVRIQTRARFVKSFSL